MLSGKKFFTTVVSFISVWSCGENPICIKNCVCGYGIIYESGTERHAVSNTIYHILLKGSSNENKRNFTGVVGTNMWSYVVACTIQSETDNYRDRSCGG